MKGADRGPAAAFQSLETAWPELWRRLARAVADRRSPWHVPVVATVGRAGEPRARVMVLRGVDAGAARLRLHTDVRAAKVVELAREPRVALVFYDAAARLQLRLEGEGRVEAEGPLADAAWAASKPFSRRCYTAPQAPGTQVPGPTSGLPPELESREPTWEESEAGRPHFAVVEVAAQRLEFLFLTVTGHRRGRFERHGDGWAGRWLVP
ncbi:MAG: pyridoxamine 5'-phosphate oxidase family protein [Sphingomonadaceae bacterium]|uniref:pyridoxamine 5'-phosphate oxidase family protein n=1 Tax=Thermaurantiacus sp. TaxID=2820283 RepID=UPI00298EF9F9|nr:pyridoxamine 5'-phosphate oxidase family protein [Thermaurantiacus sp.]MCS6986195.1 pyridoxamine 5'-phosphate oxidase family protein [Sphingomonadaceae bacterium]MDW8415851.1 pyridoxamine 5'-phosphate oxidase family protein [Thermaurantiacus sp.]